MFGVLIVAAFFIVFILIVIAGPDYAFLGLSIVFSAIQAGFYRKYVTEFTSYYMQRGILGNDHQI